MYHARDNGQSEGDRLFPHPACLQDQHREFSKSQGLTNIEYIADKFDAVKQHATPNLIPGNCMKDPRKSCKSKKVQFSGTVNVREFNSDSLVTECQGNLLTSKRKPCYQQIQPISAEPLQIIGGPLQPVSRCPVSPGSSCPTEFTRGHRVPECVEHNYSDGSGVNGADHRLTPHHYRQPPSPGTATRLVSKPNPPAIKGMGLRREPSSKSLDKSRSRGDGEMQRVCMVPTGCLDNYRIVPDAPMIVKSNPGVSMKPKPDNLKVPRPNGVFHKFEAAKKPWRNADDPRGYPELPVKHPDLSRHPDDYHNYNKEVRRDQPMYHAPKLADSEHPFTVDPRVLDRPMHRMDDECRMVGDRRPAEGAAQPRLLNANPACHQSSSSERLHRVQARTNLVDRPLDLAEQYGRQVPPILPLVNNDYERSVARNLVYKFRKSDKYNIRLHEDFRRPSREQRDYEFMAQRMQQPYVEQDQHAPYTVKMPEVKEPNEMMEWINNQNKLNDPMRIGSHMNPTQLRERYGNSYTVPCNTSTVEEYRKLGIYRANDTVYESCRY